MKYSQLTASRLKAQFNKQFPCLPPVGAVVGWQKNLFPAPSLPANWVECNGQTINDSSSPLNGQTLPNLNGGSRILKGGFIAGLLESVGLRIASGYTVNTSSIVWIIRIK